MARGEVADVQEGPGVAHERMRLALREEALLDATLIEHLDGARVKTPGSLAVEILAGSSFDDDDVDPRQRQLGRQHQPGRAASGDHHCMLGHGHPSTPMHAFRSSPDGLFRASRVHPHATGLEAEDEHQGLIDPA